METALTYLLPVFTHEYALVIYGALLWQAQQHFTKRLPLRTRVNYIGRSMIWGGMLVVFDDEIADFLLEYDVDLYYDDAENIVWYFYIAIGFTIDIIRNKITKDKDHELHNKDTRG